MPRAYNRIDFEFDMEKTGSDFVCTGNLGEWLHTQRRMKKATDGKLRKDRESLLQALVDQGKYMLNIQSIICSYF